MAMTGIGVSVIRKEACEKVTGTAKYTNDFTSVGILTAKIVTSTYAHAKIKRINTTKANALSGVRAILSGDSSNALCGSQIQDRPPLAIDKVRYYGEPIALVVADSEAIAAEAVSLIDVDYEPLPVINSPVQALKNDCAIIHENLANYTLVSDDIYPEPHTNVCDRKQIRKGNVETGFANSDIIVEAHFILPQSDHLALETRTSQAKISSDGTVFIKTAAQSPHDVKKTISKLFNIDEGKVIVSVPLVGGAFGGKAPMQLEALAYLASKAVGGREVRIVNSRENDIATSPCKMGVDATLKLGATKDGLITAAQMTFLVDTGAYSDIGPKMTQAIAVDCTGPYHIENVWCDCLCVYTNHSYSTSFRGFAHTSQTYCIERMIDKLAHRLNIDCAEIRKRNTLIPDQKSPTGVKITTSNFGDLKLCIDKLKMLINWSEGTRIAVGNNKVRAKGIACLWKTSNSPTNAVSGAVLTFNSDGSININCGCVEYGPAMKTTAAQILSERLKMDINHIHVNMDVNTLYCPEHWKTVASMTTYMIGRSVLHAADDIERQIKSLASVVLKCYPEDLSIEEEKVFVQSDPSIFLHFKDIVHGYKFDNGNTIGKPIIGCGSFVMTNLNPLDKETGIGKSGPYWTVGAQAVEVEYDTIEHTYRFLKAATVLDAGKVLNPAMAEAVVKGGMCMGLGLGSRESFTYDSEGKLLETSLRTYKVMHFGETPQYLVEFVETPQCESPYGARGIAEHGIIGIPAALGNALSLAAQTELDELPLIPETIWKAKSGGKA